METRKDMRRNYFIKKDFQSKFILKFLGLVLGGTAVLGGMLFAYLHFRGAMTTAFVDSRLSIVTTADYVLPSLIGSAIISIILVSLATAVTVLFLSHRIAGPLFRMEKSIDEIEEGNLVITTKLRATDEIQKMAEGLNDMAESLRSHAEEVKARSGELGTEIRALQVFIEGNEAVPAELHAMIKKLTEEKEKLDRAIGFFKT